MKLGVDSTWAVGTEMRQGTLHTKEVRDPKLFKEILVDNVARRSYVLDADVEEQTMDLMTVEPSRNCKGEVEEHVWGGQRRIDKLLLRKEGGLCQVTGAATVTALSGLTDHIPVVMTVGTKEDQRADKVDE